MARTRLWRAILIGVVCVAVATPTPARAKQTLGSAALEIAAGIVVAAIAVVGVAAFVAVHYSRKRTITGCVMSSLGGMSITDEGDKRTYTLSGNLQGVTTGNRIKLHGKRLEPKAPDKSLLWETTKVAKDFGVCAP